MDFTKKPLSKIPPSDNKKTGKKPPEKQKNQMLGILGGMLILTILIIAIVQTIKSLDLSNIVTHLGQSLKTDEKGNTNILLVGVGGENHDGGKLTDTIMVVSIDYKNQFLSMISIPRDFYLEDERRINRFYSDNFDQYGSAQSLYLLKELVTKITNIPIDYYIKVDFNGFEKIVDSIGGVDVYVEKDIKDYQYPKDGTYLYEPFILKAGQQHITGKTALKYARSRHSILGGANDFDRAKRQQDLLHALKDKALSLEILTNPKQIETLYNLINSSIETNLTINEIIELAKTGKDLKKENTIPLVLHDDPVRCGGLLYQVDRNLVPGNAVVYAPRGNKYSYVHFFVDNIFKNMSFLKEKPKIQIVNGTAIPIAGELKNILERFCFTLLPSKNAQNREGTEKNILKNTTIYYSTTKTENHTEIIKILTGLLPFKTKAGIPEAYLKENEKGEIPNIVIELGQDYIDKKVKKILDPEIL